MPCVVLVEPACLSFLTCAVKIAEIEASVLAAASLAAAKGLEDSSGVTTPILSSDEETSVRPELFDADTEASDGDDTPERPEPSSEVIGGG